jgi:hypothetical protein
MSRSYHVTKKAAVAAFLNGDIEPTYQLSEKEWVKKKQKLARSVASSLSDKRVPVARAIASKEKQCTARARLSREITA